MRYGILLKYCVLALVFSSLAKSEERKATISLPTVAQAHATTLAQIRSLRVQIVHEPVDRQNSTVRSHQDAWIKRGALERFSRRTLLNLPNGDTRTYRHEICLDYRTKEMASWAIADEAKLPTVRPDSQTGLTAYKAPFDRNFLDFQIYNYFLLRFAFNAADEWRTLDELIAESTEVSLSEEVLDGTKCSVVRIKNAAVEGDANSVFRVFLDPTVGYLARQIMITHAAENRDPTDFMCHINRFQDFGDGVFFPMESETYVLDANGKKHKPNRFRVEDIEINGTISDEQVQIPFPEGTLVNLLDVPVTPTTVSTRSDVELIGKNNEVVRTFGQDPKEISEYLNGLRADAPDSPFAINFFDIVLFLAVAIAVIGAISVVWRRSHARGITS